MSLPVTEPFACRHLKDELCQALINNCGMLYVLMRCCNCGVKSTFQVDPDGRIEKVYALGHLSPFNNCDSTLSIAPILNCQN